MGLSVEEVRNKLDFYCGKWAVMAFNAFIEDLSDTVWKYTLEWPYNNKSLIITIGDVRTLWTYIIPIHTIGCTTEKEILRARDAWKEFILNMEYEKPVEKHCINCRYFKLSPSAEPCRDCHACDGNFNNWESKEEKGMEDVFNYAKRDIEEVRKAWASFTKPMITTKVNPEIKDVIFNGPATIVMWSDGTKTVVKAQKGSNGKIEKIDKEKGLAMAIVKKVYGDNKGNYNDIFKKWIK